MDNLLCDESWLSDPMTPEPVPNFRCNNIYGDDVTMSPAMDEATVEEAISLDLEKESRFSTFGNKFVEFLVSKKLTDARFQAVQWLIQTRSRLELSFETIFSAANCFDRFVYETNCKEWTNWMVEIVALTSLSIASKFNEVTSPSLQELQMEGLTHLFHQKTVLEMELIILKVLEWRVNSVTSYSFSEALVSKIGLQGDYLMMSQITDHLLDDLCDLKMLEYAPSVVAVAAVWKVLEEKAALGDNFGKIMNLFGHKHKQEIMKCVNVSKTRNVANGRRRKAGEGKSFVDMLQRREVKMRNHEDYYVGDLAAIFQIIRATDRKRERDNYEDEIRQAKRMTFVMSI
ncbi:unnamed protein product [Microthlaspi erraticum]|uniref:Cyclin-like domain-containing protein n=1 Tax=Microthlaspi erraticum TaxID=1685480 RepID=A0A6D2LAI2_9BRAS|nr:unnamed protein product [Microthlaspi erraticum]